MAQVVYALIPLVVASIYFFGWRSLAVLAVVNLAGFLSEYVFARVYKQQVSSAVFVTTTLFALSMPPTVPLWIAAVGIVFGVVFGKMVFGGFGRNIFNPALSGRAFVYVSFGYPLTSSFIEPVSGFPGGFARWLPELDSLTKATPLIRLSGGQDLPFMDLFLGSTSGSLGETSALLIIITGVILLILKTASYRIVLACFIGYLVPQTAFFFIGLSGVLHPFYGLFAGSLLFAFFYMATDPISSSQTTNKGRWVYGLLVGVLTSLIRTFSSWPEAVTFAILLANMFAPLLDYAFKQAAAKKKAAAT
ncbi:MAG: RnfABCDGE type electron transport complex subunit D [Spirochaetales bacterium]|nr:RnfABCDGE type electron transport complex subunit D [Spirochaetales bacterium]